MCAIRCDWSLPDGEDLDKTQRVIAASEGLVSVWRVLGHRYPPTIDELGDWVRASITDFSIEMHLTWLQHPPSVSHRKGDDSQWALDRLLREADAERAKSQSQGAIWMTLATASKDREARVRRSRHEAAARRLVQPPWLAVQRLNAKDMLAMAAGLSAMRPAAPEVWPTTKGRGAGTWFDVGRDQGVIKLGHWWFASVCVVGGPAKHRPWSLFRPIDAPCWLHFRVAGDAHQRFRRRGWLARTFRQGGNERLADACDTLQQMTPGTVSALSIVGLAGGATPAEAKAAAASLSAQLEAWLGVRVSLQASATDVLSLCVPGFVSTRGGCRPDAWAANGEQVGGILPFDQPASPWISSDLRKIQNWVSNDVLAVTPGREPKPTVFVTDPPSGRQQAYPFDMFGGQPRYVVVVAGTSGSGKSVSLGRIVQDFSEQHPDAPIRILDAGRSAEPLAQIWRAQGLSVATPDMRDIPPFNPMAPPFPMLQGGPLQASAVKAILRLLSPDIDSHQESILGRALDLVWEAAAEGSLQGRDTPRAGIEKAMQQGDITRARALHAQACPSLTDVIDRVIAPGVSGITPTSKKAASELSEGLMRAVKQARNLLKSPPPEWHGALRLIAELGGQSPPGDRKTAVRYAVCIQLMSGDLMPDDWMLASVPGEAAMAYAQERAEHIRSTRKLLVCDEMQRLTNDKGVISWLETLAREGRKANLATMLASQRAEDFDEVVIAQASIRILFGAEATAAEQFGLHPNTIRPGVGNAALWAEMGDGNIYQSRLRVSATPEHLWTLNSGAGERELIRKLTEHYGSRTRAIRELARRIPRGKVPGDAPPPEEMFAAWDQD